MSKEQQKETAKPEPAHKEPPKNAVTLYDYSQDAGAGFESATNSDFLVPILDIVQKGSKEMEKDTPDGLKAGSLIIRALQLHFPGDKGIGFIPCGTNHVYNEWIPREKGGGLVKAFKPTDAFVLARIEAARQAKLKFGKVPTPDGNDLVETFNIFGFALTSADEEPLMIALPFTSTKIAKYKSFMTAARAITQRTENGFQKLPLYAFRRRLTTRFTEKAGHTWYNFSDIKMDGANKEEARLDPAGDLYDACRSFSQQIAQGLVSSDMRDSDQSAGSEGAATDSDTRKGPTGDEEMPF